MRSRLSLTVLVLASLPSCTPREKPSPPAVPSEAPASPSANGPATLATAKAGLGHIALDDANVYWSQTSTQTLTGQWNADGAILKTPKAGGAASTLTTGELGPRLVRVDDSSVYFTTAMGAIRRVSKSGAGGAPTTLVPKGASTFEMDAANIYWLEPGDQRRGSCAVMKAPKAGGAPIAIASEQSCSLNGARVLAVDDANVYWLESTTVSGPSGEPNPDGAVMKAPKAGGAPKALATGQRPFGLALDATHVYWTARGERTLNRVSKNGGPSTVLATAPAGTDFSTVEVDATKAYLFVRGYDDKLTVLALPKAGGTTREIATGFRGGATAIDDLAIYWTELREDGGRLLKASK